jgi:hypothetical protein
MLSSKEFGILKWAGKMTENKLPIENLELTVSSNKNNINFIYKKM